MLQVEEEKSELALICAEKDVPSDGAVMTAFVRGKRIALSRNSGVQSGVVAFDARCPHMRGPLGHGRVVDGKVICPWHFFQFDAKTGETVGCDSIMRLGVYPVKVVDGNVYVELGS